MGNVAPVCKNTPRKKQKSYVSLFLILLMVWSSYKTRRTLQSSNMPNGHFTSPHIVQSVLFSCLQIYLWTLFCTIAKCCRSLHSHAQLPLALRYRACSSEVNGETPGGSSCEQPATFTTIFSILSRGNMAWPSVFVCLCCKVLLTIACLALDSFPPHLMTINRRPIRLTTPLAPCLGGGPSTATLGLPWHTHPNCRLDNSCPPRNTTAQRDHYPGMQQKLKWTKHHHE